MHAYVRIFPQARRCRMVLAPIGQGSVECNGREVGS